MSNYYQNITAGDLLSRPKALGLIEHVGVALSPHHVLHNTPEKGEHLGTVAEFAAGQPIKVRRMKANTALINVRSQKVIGNPQPYNVISRNCEHTASEILSGAAKSPLLIFAIIMGAVALIIYLFAARR